MYRISINPILNFWKWPNIWPLSCPICMTFAEKNSNEINEVLSKLWLVANIHRTFKLISVKYSYCAHCFRIACVCASACEWQLNVRFFGSHHFTICRWFTTVPLKSGRCLVCRWPPWRPHFQTARRMVARHQALAVPHAAGGKTQRTAGLFPLWDKRESPWRRCTKPLKAISSLTACSLRGLFCLKGI